MSNIQQLTSMISALNEKFNQLEQNSKRIFELPENENLNGNSKFAISRPLDLGEITEYTSLNAILEWCIEEMQNIENATRVVQMLPPELLSGPRRIKIPTVDGDDVDVPIVWKILGVDFVETAEVIINIPDASEDNYRKDLILGTQGGDAIRMPGFESEEGIIEPIQPENTVVLTSITVFGNTVLDEPSDPIVGSNYITKSSQGWVNVLLNSAVLTFTPTINDKFSLNITSFTSGHIIPGLNMTTLANKIWAGGFFCIRTSGSYPITLEHLGSNGKIRFSFKGEEDFILTKDDGVLLFKLGPIPTTGNAIAYCLNAPSGSGGPTSADQVSYDNTASGLLAETVQEAVDELNEVKINSSDILDVNNKIKVELLPNSVMTLEGNWDASTNTPTLTDGTGNAGDVYEVTVEGTVNFGNGNISFSVGDFVVYGANGKWYRSPNTFPTKVVVTVSSNLTLNATHNGKTLRFTADGITVTCPAGLDVNFEVFLDNDTVSDNVTFDMSAITTVLAPSGNILVGSGTGYLTMTTATKVSLKGDFID